MKAIHLVDEGVYLIESAWGKYEVDGLPMPYHAPFTVASLDSIVQVEEMPGVITGYSDAEGSTLTPDEYASQRSELLRDSHQDDDGDRTFPSLDAEFEFRKFDARWSTVLRTAPTLRRKCVDVEVVEVRTQSGDPDIVSLWNSPMVGVDRKLYRMSRDKLLIREARVRVAAAGLTHEHDSRHDSVEFDKIEGEYAFRKGFDRRNQDFIGTLDQCSIEKQRLIQMVDEVVAVAFVKKTGIAAKNLGHVINQLQAIQTNLLATRARQNSEGNLSNARKDVADLIKSLTAQAMKA